MGELSRTALHGELFFVSPTEFERILSLPASHIAKTEIFATLCRINILYMIATAGSGHIGSSFSSIDMMSWLLLHEVRALTGALAATDIFFSSKGHDAPALYSVLLAQGKLDFELLHRFRKQDGLPGHPDVALPHIVTNTGSLGMGISKAKGMIEARRLSGRQGNVYVLTGDGELQEGQIWESLVSAANRKLHELTVIVDHNKLQSDTLVEKVSSLGELHAKFHAFGWHVVRCDGNNIAAFSEALAASRTVKDTPKVLIADTIKGCGVTFMEHTSIDSDVELYKFHSGAPAEDLYAAAVKELVLAADKQLARMGAAPVRIERIARTTVPAPEQSQQRMIFAYSQALLDQARKNSKIVALDADLINDTGLIAFQKHFPDRFFECGIAEQDMVSQAGGMALQGLLPIVHSFACFLSARANEQIYNNATERKKIIYVGSLAGLVPGGPGHSHQGVRDLASLGGIPGLVLIEPSCERETAQLLDWSINVHRDSSYIRLMSLPWHIPYQLPSDYRPEIGRGVALTEGHDALVFAYGPVLLSNAFIAAEKLRAEKGLHLKIVNLPWLNTIDAKWLLEMAQGIDMLFSLDNHYLAGGQGDRIADVLAQNAISTPLRRIALTRLPVCGANAEVLQAHGLNAEMLYTTFERILSRERGIS